MVTYDILILLVGLALVIGLCIGVWWASYIFEKTIEKNKPKKPKKADILGCYICPNCKGLLSQKYKYCHKCGQALDWSDTE